MNTADELVYYKDELPNISLHAFFKDTLEILRSDNITNKTLSNYYGKCEDHFTYLNKMYDEKGITLLDGVKTNVYQSFKKEFTISSEPDAKSKLTRDVFDVLDLFFLKGTREALNSIKRLHRYWMRTRKGLMDKTIVVFINGYNQVGKDTFIDLLKKECTETIHNISTVDKVKEAALILGWNGEKDDNAREALHHIKTLSNKHFNHSRKYIEEFVKKHSNCIIFVHCREPEELAYFETSVPDLKEGAVCKTLLIKNGRIEPANNAADKNVQKFIYTNTVWNEGTLDELRDEAIKYLEAILK